MSYTTLGQNGHGVTCAFRYYSWGTVAVPLTCQGCAWFDHGSHFDDDPPICTRGVWLPGRKGTCKRRKEAAS